MECRTNQDETIQSFDPKCKQPQQRWAARGSSRQQQCCRCRCCRHMNSQQSGLTTQTTMERQQQQRRSSPRLRQRQQRRCQAMWKHRDNSNTGSADTSPVGRSSSGSSLGIRQADRPAGPGISNHTEVRHWDGRDMARRQWQQRLGQLMEIRQDTAGGRDADIPYNLNITTAGSSNKSSSPSESLRVHVAVPACRTPGRSPTDGRRQDRRRNGSSGGSSRRQGGMRGDCEFRYNHHAHQPGGRDDQRRKRRQRRSGRRRRRGRVERLRHDHDPGPTPAARSNGGNGGSGTKRGGTGGAGVSNAGTITTPVQ